MRPVANGLQLYGHLVWVSLELIPLSHESARRSQRCPHPFPTTFMKTRLCRPRCGREGEAILKVQVLALTDGCHLLLVQVRFVDTLSLSACALILGPA